MGAERRPMGGQGPSRGAHDEEIGWTKRSAAPRSTRCPWESWPGLTTSRRRPRPLVGSARCAFCCALAGTCTRARLVDAGAVLVPLAQTSTTDVVSGPVRFHSQLLGSESQRAPGWSRSSGCPSVSRDDAPNPRRTGRSSRRGRKLSHRTDGWRRPNVCPGPTPTRPRGASRTTAGASLCCSSTARDQRGPPLTSPAAPSRRDGRSSSTCASVRSTCRRASSAWPAVIRALTIRR